MMTEEGHRILVPLGEALVFSAAGFISTADEISGDEAMVAKIQEKGVIPNRKRWYVKIWMRSRDRLDVSLWWNRFGGDIGCGGLSTATSGETRLVSFLFRRKSRPLDHKGWIDDACLVCLVDDVRGRSGVTK
ncbi:Uncharacterized protein Rs2_13966 [Raphanus sativus]|nr:Uncharacterized protein Rs2_13966 [Raphanus sativus]